ncbi:MAG TPA: FAD-binding protein, partial [Niabella sp.]|nr:FAD-binding protein [Niabella sp.]
MADKYEFDAIVVGSGISGGWAAKELTEKGLKVIMLERGRNVEHIKDYITANKEPWEFKHRGVRTREMIEDYPVLRRDYALNEEIKHFFVEDKDCPYTEIKPFDWFRGYQVGGRSLTWGRQSYRLNKWDFEANAREGIAVDWPIRYDDLAPWYSYVEKFAGIQGSKEGLEVLPDGEFQKPMEMNCVEKHVKKRLEAYYQNKRHLIIGRSANITETLEGRASCQYRDRCARGCIFGAYFSTQSST